LCQPAKNASGPRSPQRPCGTSRWVLKWILWDRGSNSVLAVLLHWVLRKSVRIQTLFSSVVVCDARTKACLTLHLVSNVLQLVEYYITSTNYNFCLSVNCLLFVIPSRETEQNNPCLFFQIRSRGWALELLSLKSLILNSFNWVRFTVQPIRARAKHGLYLFFATSSQQFRDFFRQLARRSKVRLAPRPESAPALFFFYFFCFESREFNSR